MSPAKLRIFGNGLIVDKSTTHPAGTVFSGGYDYDLNTLFLASEMGNPEGVRAAG